MFRPRRLLWLLGLTLLVGTAAGAGWILNHSDLNQSEPEGKAPAREADAPRSGGTICIGYVDVEPGVANLHPLQQGRVLWVAAEATKVAAGAVLLKLDDRLEKADLERAEAALKAAQKQLAKAELLPGQHADLLAQLRAAVDVAKQEQAATEAVLSLKRRSVNYKTIPAEELPAAEALVKKAAAGVRAAEARLKAAAAARPELDVARAKADVEEKEALVAKARVAVDECQVKAPTDGEVLRVLTAVGETLGANPRTPALQFCPKGPRIVRAEVRQEWASRVKVGQEAVIEDDMATRLRWTGRVKRLSDWYTHRRSQIQEPFQLNDVRTLECLVEVTGPGPEPLRIGQRMRVLVK